jgi:hypothetical protein
VENHYFFLAVIVASSKGGPQEMRSATQDVRKPARIQMGSDVPLFWKKFQIPDTQAQCMECYISVGWQFA